jgi:molybdenum cofactor cytidylyltransferase
MPGAIAKLNAVDPMITLATVPPWQRVVEGTMVGTVKIISYAVAGAALEAACSRGAGRLSGGPGAGPRCADRDRGAGRSCAEGRKGDRGGEARLAALGVTLDAVVQVAHEADAVAAAIAGGVGRTWS